MVVTSELRGFQRLKPESMPLAVDAEKKYTRKQSPEAVESFYTELHTKSLAGEGSFWQAGAVESAVKQALSRMPVAASLGGGLWLTLLGDAEGCQRGVGVETRSGGGRAKSPLKGKKSGAAGKALVKVGGAGVGG